MGKLIVVVGGQFGSEAKGRVASDLTHRAQHLPVPLAVRVGGPNAGHCVVVNGHEWKLRQLPTAAVSHKDALLAIGPGSEVDYDLLCDEIDEVEKIYGVEFVSRRLTVDPEATLLTNKHKQAEEGMNETIGSTQSGVGVARRERVMRMAGRWKDINWGQPCATGPVTPLIREQLSIDGTVIIEGCQGYGLGLHAGYYPFCSSGDFRAIDAFAMVGLSPWDPCVTAMQVWVVMRCFPIRVAGNSGELKGETSWDKLQLPEEVTTVTKRVRRVGSWDPELALRSIRANGTNVAVALTMADQKHPEVAGEREWTPRIQEIADNFEKDLGGAKIWMVGTGKTTAAWRPHL